MKHFALSALLASWIVQAPAYAASVAATIDWSSLHVSIQDLSGGLNEPVFTWGAAGYGVLDANADSWGPMEYAREDKTRDIAEAVSINAVTGKAASHAAGNMDTLSVLVSAIPSTHPISDSPYLKNNSAHAISENRVDFSLTGHGSVTFSVNWSLSSNEQIEIGEDSHAFAMLWAEDRDYYNCWNEFECGYYVHGQDGAGLYANGSDSGVFSITIATMPGLFDSINGTLVAQTSATIYANSQPVPEPVTYVLMLTGLGVVGGMARRRRACDMAARYSEERADSHTVHR